MTSQKLKSSQIKKVREDLLRQQDGKCALCGNKIPPGKDRLDHDHSTGAIRAVLDDGCNRLLGKIESNFKRFCVDLPSFLSGVKSYVDLHATDQTNLRHPTHYTPEEAKERKKKNAKRRAEKRKSQVHESQEQMQPKEKRSPGRKRRKAD